ncbi:hypothetical protein TMatcc_008192 [Talaromyces marneffei ATCC 18224]
MSASSQHGVSVIFEQRFITERQANSSLAPADVSVKYNDVKYNFTKSAQRFVGYGPEVDTAWREISYDVGDQWIPKSGLAKLGMPEYSLKVDHPVTGEEGYRVGMEVFHQLHCLNLLRKVTYKEYYEPLGGEFAAGREALQHHTSQCSSFSASENNVILMELFRSLFGGPPNEYSMYG